MRMTGTIMLIVLATLLETGGDSLMRLGIQTENAAQRTGFFVLAAALLFGYGYSLVSSPLDFGKLFGVYIAILFVVAQAMNILVFKTAPTLPVYLGGVFIIVGGLMVTYWKPTSS
jgi:drug/metabolite transporter superfamily protein YnfA